MRAMILAAGRGERMRELTMHTPKPLLRASGHYLIEYSIKNLQNAGIYDIVINICYQAEQIKQALGDGSRYGVNLIYSEEQERLETGGGILKALPLLGNAPFLVLSSDIITDYPLATLQNKLQGLAHLIMVPNPPYHPHGDFSIEHGKLTLDKNKTYTFGNIGIYHPDLFAGCQPGFFRLGSLFTPAIAAGQLTGECYEGLWYNVGTPEDLAALNRAREDSNL